MLANTDCTLYRFIDSQKIKVIDGYPTIDGVRISIKNGYERVYIPNAHWDDSRTTRITKSGLITDNSTTIYLFDKAEIPFVSGKDIIMQGKSDFIFDNTNEQTMSASLREFRQSHEFLTVSSVSHCWYGGLPHCEVSAK